MRKEREEATRFREALAQLEERRLEFQRDLDRREQACIEALHENEEQLREARENLQKIRDRAYEIILPDGTTAKVYRDGDKVRMEDGAEVSRDIVKADDLGDQRPTWSNLQSGIRRVDELNKERDAIIAYRAKIGEARERVDGSGLAVDDFDELRKELDAAKPPSVRNAVSATQANSQEPGK